MAGYLRQLSLAAILILVALLVSLPIIQFKAIYPEQALMYIANQKIQHFSDLINVYLQPRFLHYNIPFFRPSGHFLMYQVLTPVFGWHNLKALTIVNFMLLGLAGFYMVRLYSLLFRGYQFGAFVAFAIYLSHPSLILIKISILHFEFAHILFCLMGMYYFVLFCQRNAGRSVGGEFQYYGLLISALLCYVVAVTFKEPSIILGCVFVAYFIISEYSGGSVVKYVWQVCRDSNAMKLLFLVAASTGIVVTYMTLPWPGMSNPVHFTFTKGDLSYSFYLFFKSIFNLNLALFGSLRDSPYMWAGMVFPYYETAVMLVSVIVAIASGVLLFRDARERDFKKSYLFLLAAAFLFLVIPFGWGVGAPWHYHLSLIMLSLIFGFSFEYLGNIFLSQRLHRKMLLLAITIIICSVGLIVNRDSISMYSSSTYHAMTLDLNYNAIRNKPPIQKDKLANRGLFIVGEEIYHNANLLGAGAYPLIANEYFGRDVYINFAYIVYKMQPMYYYLPFEVNYNGYLFRWAYEKPDIREEIIPYENLKQAASPLIYSWLRNYDVLYYVSYDEDAKWHNFTDKFKKELMAEKARRHLRVRNYTSGGKNIAGRKIMREVFLPGRDSLLCQYKCDQTKGCNAVRYIDHGQLVAMCELYK